MQYAEVGYGLFVCLWGASDFAAAQWQWKC